MLKICNLRNFREVSPFTAQGCILSLGSKGLISMEFGSFNLDDNSVLSVLRNFVLGSCYQHFERLMVHSFSGFNGFDYYEVWLTHLGFLLSPARSEHFRCMLHYVALSQVRSVRGFFENTLDDVQVNGCTETRFI